MLEILQKLLATLAILGATLAPVVPVGNGLISVAVFEDSQGNIEVVQQSDAVYEAMGEKGGAAHNPKLTGYTWMKSFQYPADFRQPTPEELISATSTNRARPTAKELYMAEKLQTFTDDDGISVLNVVGKAIQPSMALAAVGRDATSTSGVVSAASQTWAHTITGSNVVLYLYGFVRNTNATNLQLATYNGTPMATTTPAWTDYLEGRYGWLMHLAAPTSGTNNIVTLHDSVVSTTWVGISYTGAAQTGIPDSVVTNPGDGSSNNYSLATTVVAEDSWLLLSHIAVDAICSGATTPAVLVNTDNPVQADSNGTVGTGSQSIAVTGCGNRIQAKGIISIAPFVAAVSTGYDQPLIFIGDE